MTSTDNFSVTECPACYKELGERRIPYSLKCGHTLCDTCIKGDNQELDCPVCREPIQPRTFKPNTELYQLLLELKNKKSGSFYPDLTISYDDINLGEYIDRGSYGEVYRGQWQNKEVAVKTFFTGRVPNEVLESFNTEVSIMKCLYHPNVVLLLAACPDQEKMSIVMEYIAGGSLFSHLYIKKTQFRLEDTVQLLTDVSRGLQYLHSINILHRDLKSKNVLLAGDPPHCNAKLCDFGLAMIKLESVTNSHIGTPQWTAPEVIKKSKYRFTADVYSLGMVMYEMIARKTPFPGLNVYAVVYAVTIDHAKPEIPDGSNEFLSSLVTRCLDWEPEKRPSLSSILQELQSIVTSPSICDLNLIPIFDQANSLGYVLILEDTDSGIRSYKVKDMESFHGNTKELADVQEANNQEKTPPQPDCDSQHANIRVVIGIIMRALDEKFDMLKSVVENSLIEVSSQMFTVGLISSGIIKKPSYEGIMSDFLAGLAFKKALPNVVQHCNLFFSVFYNLGGPFTDVANRLKECIIQRVKNENLCLDISFD